MTTSLCRASHIAEQKGEVYYSRSHCQTSELFMGSCELELQNDGGAELKINLLTAVLEELLLFI